MSAKLNAQLNSPDEIHQADRLDAGIETRSFAILNSNASKQTCTNISIEVGSQRRGEKSDRCRVFRVVFIEPEDFKTFFFACLLLIYF